MNYVDGFVVAVPTSNKDAYIHHARLAAEIFREHGALRITECWGDDVPDGKLTSFPMAVKLEPEETVVFSWIEWPSREVRDVGMQKVMEDPRLKQDSNPMPFDGKRMIYGGFRMMLDEGGCRDGGRLTLGPRRGAATNSGATIGGESPVPEPRRAQNSRNGEKWNTFCLVFGGHRHAVRRRHGA